MGCGPQYKKGAHAYNERIQQYLCIQRKLAKNIAKIIWKGRDVNMKDDLDVLLEEYMENLEFQREWENLEAEFNTIQALRLGNHEGIKTV